MRVLIVDDHALMRGGLVGLFDSQSDFEVVGEAGTAQEAIQLAEATNPDVVLMDLGLPDGSGIEAMTTILRRQPQVKVVFLTIHASDERAFTAIRRGARGFLPKDIPTPELLSALRGLEQGELAATRGLLSRLVDELLLFLHPGNGEATEVQPKLTAREREVLGELSTGDTNREIAARLSISINTVKIHVHNILRKLELSDRHEAADYARRHGLSIGDPEWRPPATD